MKPLFIYLVIINAVGLLLMLVDKANAKEKLQRIPEAALFGCALFGGSLGCFLGMHIARHKTKKPLFAIGLPVLLAIQLFAVYFFGIK